MTFDDCSEELSSTTSSSFYVNLASESEVEKLLLKLDKLVKASIRRKNELNRNVRNSLEKAKARYSSGGSTSALVSMRQVQKMRIEAAHHGANWCKLMGIFLQIQAELEDCHYFSSGDPLLFDLELEFFESTMENVEKKVSDLRAMLQDDATLYKELNDLLTRD